MNQTSIPITPTATFVIRFWYELTAGEERLRGCIEHIQSGEHVAFLDLEAMLSFLQRFGIRIEEQNPP